MKLLTVSFLFCAVVALTAADVFLTWPWVKIGRRHFAFVGKDLDWQNAEINCEFMGGHLASMHNFHERISIKNLINKYGGGAPSVWLGGFDGVKEGTWMWSDGSPFDNNYWCRGEPNVKNGNENCMSYNAGRRCWQDFPCPHSSPSVCVKLESASEA